MKSLSLTYSKRKVAEDNQIRGLFYVQDYITDIQEQDLLKKIDSQEWDHSLKRRVQHYGYRYSYRDRQIDKSSATKVVAPKWLNNLAHQLHIDNITPYKPNQIIINEYMPGQGIAPHIDIPGAFAEVICSLSLGSNCIMDFTKDIKISRILHRRSLVILESDARYQWKHSIPARKNDKMGGNIIPRSRRVSITFRKVVV